MKMCLLLTFFTPGALEGIIQVNTLIINYLCGFGVLEWVLLEGTIDVSKS